MEPIKTFRHSVIPRHAARTPKNRVFGPRTCCVQHTTHMTVLLLYVRRDTKVWHKNHKFASAKRASKKRMGHGMAKKSRWGEAREGVEHNAVHESSTKWTYKTLELRNQGTGKGDGQKEPIWGSGKSPWGNMARRGESFRAGELGEKGGKNFETRDA